MASPSFKHLAERKLGRFPHFIVYALLEWTLIFLLFIDGFLAFVSNEFAKFFDLKIPCLLCTRIDHVLVHRNSNFYYNGSICESHKRDISSLAYCHMHRKLSDIRSMCEGCLLSFATERESDTDAYKSLAGILHKDIDTFMEDDHRISHRQPYLGKRDDAMKVEKSGVHRCSCCGEALKMKPSSSMNASFLSQAPAPSPRAPVLTWKNEESRNLELPHIRYTELKFMSDNESEIPDDEDSHCKEENKAASVPLLPDTEDIIEEAKTPNFTKGNRFFGIPLTDSAAASPRWASRFQKKFLFEKSDFFSESNDTNETEGDSILHSLKRQVRLDRKSLIAMYMELDEERSASAVAANNAMAMITRLQAEKAAVQMEALQYQRMMEEQAEYDQEAVQVMKDLLTKREEEIKGLEAELDTYRERYGQINRVGSDECEVDADEDYQEFKSQSLSSMSEKSDCGSPNEGNQIAENGHNRERSGPLQEERGERTIEESSLDFEGDRTFLLGMLSNLEKKLNVDSGMVDHVDEYTGNENKAILTKEVSFIRERLKAIEADSGFLKHAAMTLQKGGEGTKLLTEIALHLRKLRRSLKVPSQDIDA
ncbi:probable myosin-binding protein 5 isoform X2 [Rhododendron vialii]|uniref:probable myosin-binding protein 5 isoform X2 n=1 Tax=Rhododendron vialii TaxID=182163 RepID=UPI00265F1A86|nr:probable myosin-binding protein 5 isoform X2 [Rhododendron vialii]